MWSVGCISGLIFLVNVSARMHVKEPLRRQDRVQIQDQELEAEFNDHDHIQETEKIYHTYLGEPNSVMRRRAISQRLRIHVYYDPDSIPQLSTDYKDLIKNVLVKEAVKYFKNTLKVRNGRTPIKLFRPCKYRYDVYMNTTDPTPYCAYGCVNTPKCHTVTIPEEHLKGCYKVSGSQGVKEGDDGPGVDTDYILYFAAKGTRHCGRTRIAYATYCQQEQALDRPVAGFVNLCPGDHGGSPFKQKRAIGVLKHEIFHALGFSHRLYVYYRDRQGNPLSPHRWEEVYSFMKDRRTTSSRVVKQFERPGWKHVTMLVTPAVVREARRHFGCDSLEGAELEDYGRRSTAGSHWEKRIFGNEAMTGSLGATTVFSRVTLAVMEDTGWYNVNYTMAEPLHYGFGKGCDFAKKSCKEYIQLRKNAGQSMSPYCDFEGYYHIERLSCLPDYKASAFCDLYKHQSVIDAKFQPFASLEGVNASDVPYYGGVQPMADYCPLYAMIYFFKTGGSQCENPDYQADGYDNLRRETFSAESVCFKQKGLWIIKRNSTRLNYEVTGGGCYRIKCGAAEVDGFKVYVDANEYECKTDGQEVAVHSESSELSHSGILVCSPYKVVCQFTAPQYPGDAESWNATWPWSASVKTEGSGASTLCFCWAIVIYAVFVKMALKV